MSEPTKEPTLDQMLAAFYPEQHGGEVMADRPVGEEAFADADTDRDTNTGSGTATS